MSDSNHTRIDTYIHNGCPVVQDTHLSVGPLESVGVSCVSRRLLSVCRDSFKLKVLRVVPPIRKKSWD